MIKTMVKKSLELPKRVVPILVVLPRVGVAPDTKTYGDQVLQALGVYEK